ncbi:hypothetical protein KOAAANKH_03302 [Brevundimonas sp. NIBR10]|uniref:DUF4170 domain-containing protein n=1 Tax=Brevundimonas sp. NIBR10 TaxID=3015997 RepID=UPI0022F1AE8B|nr:DUF4170 domain-containing protein [Brevundimonas sp. NIBR10]WGM48404.1 hypothetical protein KOAAANKH_03302 [Brevundimonas sp. NIBR10]
MPQTPDVENPQLLHLVIGGELRHLDAPVFRDLTKVEFVGAYGSYAEARQAWKARAQATVDNALMRFFILHAHKMIDPRGDDHAH